MSLIGRFKSLNLLISTIKKTQSRNYSSVLWNKAKNSSQLLYKVHTFQNPINCRFISCQRISKHIKLITEDNRTIICKDAKTLKLKQDSNGKPLVLMLSWLDAEHKHVMKFAQIYLDQGFDVAVSQITLWQVFWPRHGLQLISHEVVNFLANNENYQQVILHGFSVGGYQFGDCLNIMNKNKKKYQSTVNRVVAQVWDSMIDINTLTVGASRAFILGHPLLHDPLQKILDIYLGIFPKAVAQCYHQSSEMFQNNLILAPALLITSKVDPASTIPANEGIVDSWRKNGMDVKLKCFDESPHVMHFAKYRQEYTQMLYEHLRSVNMLNKK